tara:strand:- start:187 stop:633 length:447 start_codon:yes stop_codon:yes gene_type:complete
MALGIDVSQQNLKSSRKGLNLINNKKKLFNLTKCKSIIREFFEIIKEYKNGVKFFSSQFTFDQDDNFQINQSSCLNFRYFMKTNFNKINNSIDTGNIKEFIQSEISFLKWLKQKKRNYNDCFNKTSIMKGRIKYFLYYEDVVPELSTN